MPIIDAGNDNEMFMKAHRTSVFPSLEDNCESCVRLSSVVASDDPQIRTFQPQVAYRIW